MQIAKLDPAIKQCRMDLSASSPADQIKYGPVAQEAAMLCVDTTHAVKKLDVDTQIHLAAADAAKVSSLKRSDDWTKFSCAAGATLIAIGIGFGFTPVGWAVGLLIALAGLLFGGGAAIFIQNSKESRAEQTRVDYYNDNTRLAQLEKDYERAKPLADQYNNTVSAHLLSVAHAHPFFLPSRPVPLQQPNSGRVSMPGFPTPGF